MAEILVNGRWPLKVPAHRENPFKFGWENWEKEFLAKAYEVIKDDDIVFDIGAENGDLSALYASWGGRVVLVEPSPHYWQTIRAIFEANELDGPLGCFHGFAGASIRGQEGMGARDFLEWPDAAYLEFADTGFRHLAEHPHIPVTRIDQLKNIDIPDVIMIDTEGSELEVLKGGRDTLINYSPKVFVAIHPPILRDRYNTEPEQVHEFMALAGYVGEHIHTDHEEHWLFTQKGGSHV